MKYEPKVYYQRKRGVVEEINRAIQAVDDDVAAANAIGRRRWVDPGPIEYGPSQIEAPEDGHGDGTTQPQPDNKPKKVEPKKPDPKVQPKVPVKRSEAKPPATKPAAGAQPAAKQPDAQPDAGKQSDAAVQPGTAKPDGAKPDGAKPDASAA